MKDAVHDAARARLATDQHPTRAERMAVQARRRRSRFDPPPSSPPQPACHHSIIRSIRAGGALIRHGDESSVRQCDALVQCDAALRRIWHDSGTDRAVPQPLPSGFSPSFGDAWVMFLYLRCQAIAL